MSDEYDWNQDAEVRADLELRERTANVRTPSVVAFGSPEFVDAWKCQLPRCAVQIPVTSDAVERLAIFNAELTRRGERPIPTDAVLFCEEHRQSRQDARETSQVARRERVARNVRTLKEAHNPLLLEEVITELRRDHHPDVDGLLASLTGRESSKRKVRL